MFRVTNVCRDQAKNSVKLQERETERERVSEGKTLLFTIVKCLPKNLNNGREIQRKGKNVYNI